MNELIPAALIFKHLTSIRALPHSTSISSTTSIILLFERFDPLIVGSKLINSKIIDVMDEIEFECGWTRALGCKRIFP